MNKGCKAVNPGSKLADASCSKVASTAYASLGQGLVIVVSACLKQNGHICTTVSVKTDVVILRKNACNC